MYIQLNYTKNSLTSTSENESTFKITKTELHVRVVTLNIEDNNRLNELLSENESDDSVINSKSKINKCKRTVFWNEHKSKIEDVDQAANNTNFKRTLLDASIPGVKRLFVAAFPHDLLRNNDRRYFIPTTNVRDYNILIDGRNFYDQNISEDLRRIKKSNDWKR